MDPRERINDPEEVLRTALDGHQASIWTALPGKVVSFDPVAMTGVIQPTIQGVQQAQDGSTKNVNMPLLLDCPVHFPSGGGYTLTFPVAEGDECVVVFSSRCIDGWWETGDTAPQAEVRFHDLSDGFFFPKVWSKPRTIQNVSANSAQLRSDDGEMYIELAADHVINVVTPGNVNMNVGGNVQATVQGTTSVNSTGNVSVETQGDATVSAQGNATVSGQAGATVSSPASVSIDGAAGVNIQTNGTANCTVNGSMTATISGALNVTAGSISLN